MGTPSLRATQASNSSANVLNWRNNVADQLAATRSELAEIHRELYEAAQLQRKLSGPRILHRGEFEIAAEIFPVRHLSGDYFSILDLDDTTTLLAIGDIAGKGLTAGIWFTHLLGLTCMYAESIVNPGEALAALNSHLCQSPAPPPLTSLYLARLNWSSGELVYSNAGHPAPLLMRANREFESLTAGGPVLGAVPLANFESAAVTLNSGDTLLGYTDGLPECSNQNQEEFGAQRVIEELRKANAEASADELLFSIVGAAQDFAASQPRADDCTVMAVRRS
jgi:serine phosphatase RsbU (regulator of sigma subunit)